MVERSDLLVQIVDARSPLLFWSRDLNSYARDLGPKKENLLLINKADLITESQRASWAEYFATIDVGAVFWSATAPEESEECVLDVESIDLSDTDGHEPNRRAAIGRICTTAQLLTLFRSFREHLDDDRKAIVVGMVGYPNVGKSSTVNRLLGYKKVPVSATPGKTHHFQTLQVDGELILCDCPGLVMPSFALSRDEMLLNGVLSASQMRDYFSPISLLCAAIPKRIFESFYGITLRLPSANEQDDPLCVHEKTTAQPLLTAVAFMRGFMSSKGIPDCSRAARLIITDVTNGKLRYAAAPPCTDQMEFDDFAEFVKHDAGRSGLVQLEALEKRRLLDKPKIDELDSGFFVEWISSAHTKQRTAAVASESSSKKHFNRNKKEKLRRMHNDLNP